MYCFSIRHMNTIFILDVLLKYNLRILNDALKHMVYTICILLMLLEYTISVFHPDILARGGKIEF